MKKIFSLLALFLIIITSHAQIKKIPPVIKIPVWDITSRTTGQRGYNKISIKLYFTTTEGLGKTLNFISNTDISKVEITFINNTYPKSTSTYLDNIRTGLWYLESGAYNSGLTKGYILHFYVKDFDKPVWAATVIPGK